MKLYNTLTKKIEEIRPLEEDKLKVFVCGPTVYDYIHIGNAKTYVQSDMLVRFLRYINYDVTYLMNITDIDDKIIQRANEQSIDFTELTKKYSEAFYEDMASLGNSAVTTFAPATDFISDIIRQVETLIDKGHAYQIDDGIYYEIASFPEYGKLSGRHDISEDDAQSRIDESDQKKGWNDFCLWKFSKPGEPQWEAPFGAGRPGWHIEDTAITEHFFGPQYDIHGGAVDLIFPHHEAEITQMESASGLKPFVGHWFHVGFLTVNDKRMGKSMNNFFTVKDVFEKGYSADVIRLFFMQAHYRKGLNFTWDNLNAASNRLENWRSYASLRWQTSDDIEDQSIELITALQAIELALQNDFDTPLTLSIIEDAFGTVQKGLSTKSEKAFNSLLDSIDSIFGLKLCESTPDISGEIRELLSSRLAARQSGDWSKSDELRGRLSDLGVSVRDQADKQIWSYNTPKA